MDLKPVGHLFMLACLNMVYECYCNILEARVKVFLSKYGMDDRHNIAQQWQR